MKDPNLLAARDEIGAILKRRDIVGVVILANSTDRMEYLSQLEASWSCAFTEETMHGKVLRVRCKEEEYPSKEKAKETLTATVGALLGMIDVMGNIKEGLLMMCKRIGEKVDIQHWSKREDTHEN
jgi:hypothetical protein